MLYVLKLSEPIGNIEKSHGHAQFYLGFCEDGRLDQRLREHRTGTGAAFTRAAVERGLTLEVVLTMPGTRADERRLKTTYKNNRKLVERMSKKQIAL